MLRLHQPKFHASIDPSQCSVSPFRNCCSVIPGFALSISAGSAFRKTSGTKGLLISSSRRCCERSWWSGDWHGCHACLGAGRERSGAGSRQAAMTSSSFPHLCISIQSCCKYRSGQRGEVQCILRVTVRSMRSPEFVFVSSIYSRYGSSSLSALQKDLRSRSFHSFGQTLHASGLVRRASCIVLNDVVWTQVRLNAWSSISATMVNVCE